MNEVVERGQRCCCWICRRCRRRGRIVLAAVVVVVVVAVVFVVVVAIVAAAADAVAVDNVIDVGTRIAESGRTGNGDGNDKLPLVELENLLEIACKRKSTARRARSILYFPSFEERREKKRWT